MAQIKDEKISDTTSNLFNGPNANYRPNDEFQGGGLGGSRGDHVSRLLNNKLSANFNRFKPYGLTQRFNRTVLSFLNGSENRYFKSTFRATRAIGDLNGRPQWMDKHNNMKIIDINYQFMQTNTTERKPFRRCYLYIENLVDCTEEELLEMFKPYGEVSDHSLDKEKKFGSIKLDYYINAEKAKNELDGQLRKGHMLKISFAPIPAAIKVKYLAPHVSNELLQYAFSIFGDIDRCLVMVDESNNSTGEGIIEFSCENSANNALKHCSVNYLFLTRSLRPCIVETYELLDSSVGLPEKLLAKIMFVGNQRSNPPRFADPKSFEFTVGIRWKELADLHKSKEEALKREMKLEEKKLEAQMEYARYEHETKLLNEESHAQLLNRKKREMELIINNLNEDIRRLREDSNVRSHQHDEPGSDFHNDNNHQGDSDIMSRGNCNHSESGREGDGGVFTGSLTNRLDNLYSFHFQALWNDHLKQMMVPNHKFPLTDTTERKFLSRCGLYIENLWDCTEEELLEMFKPYGEVSDHSLDKEKKFGFIKLDYRINAEKAKKELDGQLRKGHILNMRFAPISAAIKVKYLDPCVSNELLQYAFSIFGDIDRCLVMVDESNNSTGEGIIEFSCENSANNALKHCSVGCFFLTSSLRPCIVETYELLDSSVGLPEKLLAKKMLVGIQRSNPPRFVDPKSFEFTVGIRWKELDDLYKSKEEELKREMKLEEKKLEAQMEYARYEHETKLLNEELHKLKLNREQQKLEWKMNEHQEQDQRLKEE